MNHDKIKKVLSSSFMQVFFILIALIVLGTMLLVHPFRAAYKGGTFGLVFGVIVGGAVLGLALFVAYKALPKMIKAMMGTHPLLLAIKENQKDYITWIYIKQIDTTLGNGGATVGRSNNIGIYDKNGDLYDLIIPRKESAEDYMKYLTTTFDIPNVGFSDKTREKMNKLAGRKIS